MIVTIDSVNLNLQKNGRSVHEITYKNSTGKTISRTVGAETTVGKYVAKCKAGETKELKFQQKEYNGKTYNSLIMVKDVTGDGETRRFKPYAPAGNKDESIRNQVFLKVAGELFAAGKVKSLEAGAIMARDVYKTLSETATTCDNLATLDKKGKEATAAAGTTNSDVDDYFPDIEIEDGPAF